MQQIRKGGAKFAILSIDVGGGLLPHHMSRGKFLWCRWKPLGLNFKNLKSLGKKGVPLYRSATACMRNLHSRNRLYEWLFHFFGLGVCVTTCIHVLLGRPLMHQYRVHYTHLVWQLCTPYPVGSYTLFSKRSTGFWTLHLFWGGCNFWRLIKNRKLISTISWSSAGAILS